MGDSSDDDSPPVKPRKKVIARGNQPTVTEEMVKRKYVALYDFKARDDDELSMKQGDVFTKVIKSSKSDKAYIEVTNTKGKTGLVPLSYLELHVEPEEPRAVQRKKSNRASPTEEKYFPYANHEVTEEDLSEAGRVLQTCILTVRPEMMKVKKGQEQCMLGTDMVDFVIDQSGDELSHHEAISIWQLLLENGIIQQVDKNTIFKDKKQLYIFNDQQMESPSRQEKKECRKKLSPTLDLLKEAGPDATIRTILRKDQEDRTDEDISQICELCNNVKSFQELSTTTQKKLAAVAEFKEYSDSGSVVYKKGDHATSWYIILKGSVKQIKDKKTVLTKGDDFGQVVDDGDIRNEKIIIKDDDTHFLTLMNEHTSEVMKQPKKKKQKQKVQIREEQLECSNDESKKNLTLEQFFSNYKIKEKTRDILDDNGIDDIQLLGNMSEEKLERMGINIGQITRILNGIEDMQDEDDTAHQPKTKHEIPKERPKVKRDDADVESDQDGDNDAVSRRKKIQKGKQIKKKEGESEDDDTLSGKGYKQQEKHLVPSRKPDVKPKRYAAASKNVEKHMKQYQQTFGNVMDKKKRTKTGEKHFNELVYAAQTTEEKGRLRKFGEYVKRTLKAFMGLVEEPAYTGRYDRVIKGSTEEKNGFVIHKLPLLVTYSDQRNKIRKCLIGSFVDTAPRKTILLVGATGAGKSTMIDGMINHIYGIELEDKYRLKIIDLEKGEGENNQSTSQTEWITAYTITASKFTNTKYSFTIVDMPGFGDTRGIERDKILMQNVKHLFSTTGESGLESIDAVCFLAKTSDARLTPTQTYIFDQILSIFGHNIKAHIHIFVSFADGNEPEVLNALKVAKVPYNKYFKFNNAALFPNENDPFIPIYWEMGRAGYVEFFDFLKNVRAESLVLTKEVLQEREQLNLRVESLQKNIKKAVSIIENKKHLMKQIEENRKTMEETKDYEITVKQPQKEKVKCPPKVYVTYCEICKVTCHDECPTKRDEDLAECAVMDNDGKCVVCPGKCEWSDHVSNDFYFKETVIKLKTTIENMKKKYTKAEQKKGKNEDLLKGLKGECKTLQNDVDDMVNKVTICLNRLDQIALKKGPPSEENYIDLLIERERQEGGDGYKERIETLKEMKNKAQTVTQIAKEKSVVEGLRESSDSDDSYSDGDHFPTKRDSDDDDTADELD